jgi:hypothetical protein
VTREDLIKLTQKPGYGIVSTTDKNHLPGQGCAPVKPAVMESRPRPKQVGPRKIKEVDPRKFHVVVTNYRRRLLDEDNLCEKYVVDCVRYARIIPGDAPQTTHIEVRQCKVDSESDERVEVDISELPGKD